MSLPSTLAGKSLNIAGVGLASLVCLAAWPVSRLQSAPDAPGVLKLSVIDEATKQPTPARVDVIDRDGKAYFAEDALPIGGDCTDPEIPWKGTREQALARLSRKINNPNTGTEQFYTGGACRLSLPKGDYRVRVFKGTEFRVETREVWIEPGRTQELTVSLSRWINLPKMGWYGSDAHLHIARPIPELNPHISKWMQAEDIHVAHCLRLGHIRRFQATPQYGLGSESLYHEGDYWLASGQENPRTDVLGHTFILGANKAFNFPDDYLVYRNFWQEAQRQNALAGYAHFALRRGGANGLAIDLPDSNLAFIQVLEFDKGGYDIWYDTLNMGFRLAPIGGTDYPCIPVMPGRDRFYARVEGPLTYDSWLEGIRRSRTFISNGPALELSVNGKGMGGQMLLDKPGPVQVEATVRFDPARDGVEVLEIVENGKVVKSFPREGAAGEISARFSHEAREAAWLAVRSAGKKRNEIPSPWSVHMEIPPSLAHSAPVYVMVKGTPGLAAHPRAKRVAAAWLERLEVLEQRLGDKGIRDIANRVNNDGVEADRLRKGRDKLLARIAVAKSFYRERSR